MHMRQYEVLPRQGVERGRQLTAAALLCALLAAVTVAVESPRQPAEAATSDHSGDSSGSAATPTTSAATETTPKVPLNLTVSLSGSWVSLSWTHPGDATITGYRYRVRAMDAESAYSEWVNISSGSVDRLRFTPLLDSGLLNKHLNVQLQAVNAAGRSSASVVASTKALGVPSRLMASLSGGSVILSWDNPFDDSIRSYEYRIKTAGAGNVYGSWTGIAGSDASTTSATIPVTGSERRIVQLRANGSGTSDSASASTGPPAWLSGFVSPGGSSLGSGFHVTWTAAAGSPKGSVTMRWADPGDDSIFKYQYKLKPQGGSYSQTIDIPLGDLTVDSFAGTVSYTFVLPTPEEYRVRLWPVNNKGVGAGERFNVKPSWPAPAVPTGFRASLSGGSLSLSWDNPFNGSVQRYEYRIKTAGAGHYGSWTNITDRVPKHVNPPEVSGAVRFKNVPTLSVKIPVTGIERRIVELRAYNRHDVGGPSKPASASTG